MTERLYAHQIVFGVKNGYIHSDRIFLSESEIAAPPASESAPTQSETPLIPKGMLDALRKHQRQIDEDGSEVGVSRQAVDEAVDLLESFQRELTASAERVRELEARLPRGMKHCTIVFKECGEGHGWLTATNWVQHDCPTCRAEAAESALVVALSAKNAATTEMLKEAQEHDETRAALAENAAMLARQCDLAREAETALAACGKDAERYRWLRGLHIETAFPRKGVFIGEIRQPDGRDVCLTGVDADRAIDTALASAKERGK